MVGAIPRNDSRGCNRGLASLCRGSSGILPDKSCNSLKHTRTHVVCRGEMGDYSQLQDKVSLLLSLSYLQNVVSNLLRLESFQPGNQKISYSSC